VSLGLEKLDRAWTSLKIELKPKKSQNSEPEPKICQKLSPGHERLKKLARALKRSNLAQLEP